MAKAKSSETNRLWPFYSLVALFVRRFGLLLLGGLVVYSAILVAAQTHQYRLATSEYKKLEDEQNLLDLNWQKLRLEQSALAEHSRIEAIAEKKLKMKHLDKKSEVIVESEIKRETQKPRE
ncbi:cell division protein FtsL [Kangiella sp. TOML190]|uniref:cell division protein FtsL n=1 Tax=Kangiella sp. TOML190 TaxID=2931351 RepID=UPI00203A70D2|nr:cell division protein FtsL [Kangiella sp. TOML190]